MAIRKAFVFRGGDRIKPTHEPLKYLNNSIAKVKTTLQKYGEWEVDDFVLKSSDDISNKLSSIEDNQDNEVLLFYTGHGVSKDKTKKYYLIGKDYKEILFDNIITPLQEFYHTRFTLIIDACFSNEAIKFAPNADNIELVTSVFSGFAYESEDNQSTNFVHYFCDSIKNTTLAFDKPVYLKDICENIFKDEEKKQKPVLAPTLKTQYTNSIIIAYSQNKNFTPSEIKRNEKYISREIDTVISQKIDSKSKGLIVINAEGGFGKSTLLQNLLLKNEKTPIILIATQNIKTTNFVDLLLDDDMTVIQNCSRVNEVKRRYIKGEDDLEVALLEAIKEDFGEFGILMIDTFEKIKNMEIEYKVKFSNDGTIEPKRNKDTGLFRHYIDKLFDYMYTNTLFISAGRNSFRDTNLGIDENRVTEIEVDKFSDENIKEYFENSNIALPEDDNKISHINQITSGNAMLISLFPKIIKDYDNDWEVLDFDEMDRRIENDRENGMLYYLTDRILSHLDSSVELYRLIIPRVLNRDIEKILFEDLKVFDKLIDSGLAYRGRGKEFDRIYLHDSVNSAIVANAKSELTLNHSSYHDNPKVEEIHRKLIDYYKKHKNLFDINSDFEICYHNIMLRRDFEKDFDIDREEFASLAFSSLSLDNSDKLKVCENFNILSYFQISKFVKVWYEEKDKWLSMISDNLYNELKKYSAKGKAESASVLQNIEILEEILRTKKYMQNDWSIYYLFGNAYNDKKEYDKAIEAFEKAIEINPKKDEAYYNMGNAYNDKKEYDKAIEINPKKDEAYYNMGNAYNDKKEYDKAIEAFEKAIEINPKDAKAYYNMGYAYNDKKEYDKAIEAYKKAVKINPKDAYAYNNLFELYLTQNMPFDEVLESKYKELFSEDINQFIKYEMLKILEAISRDIEYPLSLKEWQEKYKGVDLANWGWDKIDEWIESLPNGEKKKKLQEAVRVFKAYKGGV